jgi:hypothetical protein
MRLQLSHVDQLSELGSIRMLGQEEVLLPFKTPSLLHAV